MVHRENQVLGKGNICDGCGQGSSELSASLSGSSWWLMLRGETETGCRHGDLHHV